jgi:hypothetical protein
MSTDWSKAKRLLAGKQTRRVNYVALPELGLKVLTRQWQRISDLEQLGCLLYAQQYTDPANYPSSTESVETVLSVLNPRAGKKPYPGTWYQISTRAGPVKGVTDTPGIVQVLVQYDDDLTLTTRNDGEVLVTEQHKGYATRGLAVAWLVTQLGTKVTGAIKTGGVHQAENGWVAELGTSTPQAWDTEDYSFADMWGSTTVRMWGNQTKTFSDLRKASLVIGMNNSFDHRLDPATGLYSGNYSKRYPTGGSANSNEWADFNKTWQAKIPSYGMVGNVRKRRLISVTCGILHTMSAAVAQLWLKPADVTHMNTNWNSINGGRHIECTYMDITAFGAWENDDASATPFT